MCCKTCGGYGEVLDCNVLTQCPDCKSFIEEPTNKSFEIAMRWLEEALTKPQDRG